MIEAIDVLKCHRVSKSDVTFWIVAAAILQAMTGVYTLPFPHNVKLGAHVKH